jgi:hypothetical protein
MVRPTKIRLEVSSHCQLRCPSCPTTTGHIHPAVGSGFLKLSTFCDLLDSNPWIDEIELSNYGEIFLNPALPEILAEGYRRGVALTASNGVNLNNAKPEALEAVVRYRLRAMNCSIDGASNDTYRVYRKRGNFDRVIANIREINRWKKELSSEYPRLSWQFIIFGHNEHEIAAARQMAQELGMRFHTKLTWDPDFSPVRDVEKVRRESGVGAASRAEFKEQTGHHLKHAICHQLWDRPQINWDGKLLGCGRNFWGDFGGNAFTDGLEACLNNEKANYARQMLLGFQPSRPDIPCTTCENYLHMQSSGRWLRRSSPLLRAMNVLRAAILRMGTAPRHGASGLQ